MGGIEASRIGSCGTNFEAMVERRYEQRFCDPQSLGFGERLGLLWEGRLKAHPPSSLQDCSAYILNVNPQPYLSEIYCHGRCQQVRGCVSNR